MTASRMLTVTLTAASLTLWTWIGAGAADKAAPPAPEKPKVAAPAKKQLKPTDTVAEVNGKKITKADYDRALVALTKSVQQMTGGSAPAAVPAALREDLVNQLVGREVIYQESTKFAPKDLSKKVDEQIQGIKGSYPKPEAFQERLKSEGVTEKEFREIVSKELLIRNYAETQIAPKIKVSEADAKKFYEENKAKMVEPEQVRASHILFLVPQGAKPEEKQKALARAKEIQKKAAKGEDFAKLATENSQDPGSAKGGGDLGFFTRERMVEPFANAAFALKAGQVSDVVETPFGFHVIKLAERKASHQQSFEELKPKITGYLQNQALSQGLLAKVEQLKKGAKVKILVPNP